MLLSEVRGDLVRFFTGEQALRLRSAVEADASQRSSISVADHEAAIGFVHSQGGDIDKRGSS
jgi:hypothetical protein